jgi:hypothetical protein
MWSETFCGFGAVFWKLSNQSLYGPLLGSLPYVSKSSQCGEVKGERERERERDGVSKRGIQSDLIWLNITPPAATVAVALRLRITVCLFGATN